MIHPKSYLNGLETPLRGSNAIWAIFGHILSEYRMNYIRCNEIKINF